MIEPITIERWDIAQAAERALHNKSLEEGISHYQISYGHNFRYLGIDFNQVQENIIEIGCADFPALRYVESIGSIIIEPMASQHLSQFCAHKDIMLIQEPFENIDNADFLSNYEIWMFNVLQHVQDPDKFIHNAKKARCVRYFEPIETELTDYHPFSFTRNDFETWFPGVNHYYNETKNQCFHDGPCCYGVYKNETP
jgi:hypothetical protein